MEAILRVMKGVTGKGEEELRELMREELCQMSKEVSAMKEILKEPKARTAVKKSAEVTAAPVEAEVTSEVKPKARTAVKKSAEVTEVTAAEVTAAEVTAEVKAKSAEVKPKAKKEPKAKSAELTEVTAPTVEAEVAEVKPEEESVEVEEEVEVEEVEYEGVTYLRSSKGVMYDMMTSEEIGRWNEETKSIEVE